MKRTRPIKLTYKQKHYLFISIVLLLVGCIPTTTTKPLNTIDSTVESKQNDSLMTTATPESKTQKVIPTNTPRVSSSPIASPTMIILPENSTPTPIDAALNILTPTLTIEQKANNFTRLMTKTEECDLPCWWGIIPGESALETIADQFVPLGLDWWEEWNQLDFSNPESGAILLFEEEGSIIQSIKVGGRRGEGDRFIQDWERYSLDQVLSHYGMPSDVFVYYPYRPDPGADPAFHLFIFYDEQGIAIDYAGNATDKNGGESVACPNLDEIFQINLFLYQPSRVKNVIETVIPPETVSFIAEPETVYDLISWEQATDTTLESFYEQFSQPDFDGCFDFKRYWTS